MFCHIFWLETQLFNFLGSYKVVDSESFNFYSLGFWASEHNIRYGAFAGS